MAGVLAAVVAGVLAVVAGVCIILSVCTGKKRSNYTYLILFYFLLKQCIICKVHKKKTVQDSTDVVSISAVISSQ